MELANFWIIEKQLIHKLFKVLVPRYQNYTTSFTKLHNAPYIYPGYAYKRAVLELKGVFYNKFYSFTNLKKVTAEININCNYRECISHYRTSQPIST